MSFNRPEAKNALSRNVVRLVGVQMPDLWVWSLMVLCSFQTILRL